MVGGHAQPFVRVLYGVQWPHTQNTTTTKKQNRICDHPKTLYSIMGEMLCAGFVGNKRHAKRVTKSYRYSI